MGLLEYLFFYLFPVLAASIGIGWVLSKLAPKVRAMFWGLGGLGFCAFFRLGLHISSWILSQDDGSEKVWHTSEKIVNAALLSPLLAITLGFAGVLVFLRTRASNRGRWDHISFVLCFSVVLVAIVEIFFNVSGGEPGKYFPWTEAQTVHSLRSVYSANLIYAAHHQQMFAPSLGDLRLDTHSAEITPALANGKTHGYRFSYELSGMAANRFRVVAEPLVPGFSGVRYFSLDQSGITRFDNKVPTDTSPTL